MVILALPIIEGAVLLGAVAILFSGSTEHPYQELLDQGKLLASGVTPGGRAFAGQVQSYRKGKISIEVDEAEGLEWVDLSLVDDLKYYAKQETA